MLNPHNLMIGVIREGIDELQPSPSSRAELTGMFRALVGSDPALKPIAEAMDRFGERERHFFRGVIPREENEAEGVA